MCIHCALNFAEKTKIQNDFQIYSTTYEILLQLPVPNIVGLK
jgi:hypothetical protein